MPGGFLMLDRSGNVPCPLCEVPMRPETAEVLARTFRLILRCPQCAAVQEVTLPRKAASAVRKAA